MRAVKAWGAAGAVVVALAAAPATAGVAYSEATMGDLSNLGGVPTAITLVPGDNQILGTTGNPGSGTDRDYFRITLVPGQSLTALTVLAGTAPLGLGFIGVQAGLQVTVPTNAPSAAGLLGATHYAAADVGTDILPRLGTGFDAIHFSGPLGAGDFSFWVQDFNRGSSPYALALTVSAVPEPATAALWAAGGLVLVGWGWVAAQAGWG